MQLMPATAKVVAKRSGVGYSVNRLDEADYNMALGTTFLGSLVSQFSGSYLMAAAAYNAGPGRPISWINACGDPRTSTSDPVDYIECIPISETRNYVMRVLEGMQVYRARLNGGHAPLSLPGDLKRGGYGQQYASSGATIDALLEGSLGASNGVQLDPDSAVVASTPVPNPPEIELIKPSRAERLREMREAGAHHKGAKGKADRGGRSTGKHAASHGAGGGHAKAKHRHK